MKAFILTFFTIFSCVFLCWAEGNQEGLKSTIYLKNGDMVTGKIVSQTAEEILLKTSYGEIKIKTSDVNSISFGDKPTQQKEQNKQAKNEEMTSIKEGEFQYKYVYLLGVEGLEGQTAFFVSFKNDITPVFGYTVTNIFMSENLRMANNFLNGMAINAATAGIYYDVIDGLKKDIAGEIIERKLNVTLSLTYLRYDLSSSYLEVPEEYASNPLMASALKGFHMGMNGASGEIIVTMPIIQRVLLEARGSYGYIEDSKYHDAGADIIFIPLKAFPRMKIRLGALLNSLGGGSSDNSTSIVAGFSYGWGPFYRSISINPEVK